MTCIVGFIEKRKTSSTVWVGSDSLGSEEDEGNIVQRADDKVFRVARRFLVGFAGSYRMGNLLQYTLKPPKQPEGMGVHEYMSTLFINSVRACFDAGGFSRKKDNVEEIDGEFLVGYKGRLFAVESDYQVAELRVPYAAAGCGASFALGSLFTTNRLRKISAKRKVKVALEAAETYSAYVRKPFVIRSMRSVNG